MLPVIKTLEDLVRAGIIKEYVIGGATALLYFSQPTFTDDIDVFVYLAESGPRLLNISPIYKYLIEHRGATTKEDHILIEGFPIQFLVPYDDLSEEAFKKAVMAKIEGAQFRVFDLEHLMAIMIQLGKAKYIERLRILVENKSFDSKKLHRILTRFKLLGKWDKIKAGWKVTRA